MVQQYLRGLKKLKELPDDNIFRILYFLGDIKVSSTKNDPTIRVAFVKYDPYKEKIGTTTLFGTKGYFYPYITKEEYHKGIFEYYNISIELIPLLKIGSIWHKQTEIAYVLLDSKYNIIAEVGIDVSTFEDINQSIVNVKENGISKIGWLEIPKKFKEHYVLKIPITKNYKGKTTNELILIPLTEICRKFYFLSSKCVHGILTGYFIDNQPELFINHEDKVSESKTNKSVHIKYLDSKLGQNESVIAAFILHSEKVKNFIKLISTSLQTSLYNESGYITKTNLPYESGLIGMTLRGRKVVLRENINAYYVFEILNCQGDTPFEEIYTYFESKELKENPNDGAYVPPLIKFKSTQEDEIDLLNFADVQDSNYVPIDYKYVEDVKSGYLGIKFNKKIKLKSDKSVHSNIIYTDDEITAVTTGIGDNVAGSEVPSVRLTSDDKFSFHSNYRNPFRFVEIDCLNILKSTLDNLPGLIKSYSSKIEADSQTKIQSEELNKLIKEVHLKTKDYIKIKYFSFGNIRPKSEAETFVIANLESRWSIREDSSGKKRLRKALVATLDVSSKHYLIVEFEKFKYDVTRLIVIEGNNVSEFENEELVKNIFKACCECEASYSTLHRNNLINNFKLNFLNHKYNYSVEYLTRRILKIITMYN